MPILFSWDWENLAVYATYQIVRNSFLPFLWALMEVWILLFRKHSRCTTLLFHSYPSVDGHLEEWCCDGTWWRGPNSQLFPKWASSLSILKLIWTWQWKGEGKECLIKISVYSFPLWVRIPGCMKRNSWVLCCHVNVERDAWQHVNWSQSRYVCRQAIWKWQHMPRRWLADGHNEITWKAEGLSGRRTQRKQCSSLV